MTDLLQERISTLERRIEAQPKSPLFARLAGYYLQTGRTEEALRLCDEGLAHHPFYSTAHLIKARALFELKMMAEAKREFEVVHGLLPTNETIATLYSSIDLGPSADISAPSIVEESPAQETTAESYFQPSAEVSTEEPPQAQVEETPTSEMTIEEEPMVQSEEPFAQPSEETPFAPETPTVEAEQALAPETEQAPAEDFGFGAMQTTGPSPAEETSAPEETISSYDSSDPLAALRAETTEEAPSVSDATPAEPEQTPDYFDAFAQLQQAAQEVPETETPPQAEEENPFAAFGGGTEAPTVSAGGTGEETYEEFAARTRMELFGTENTSTLDEYLGSSSASAPSSNHIEELAEKLKTPKKITPVINFAEKAPRTVSEEDTPSSAGFVTPTLAEIYVKQGWYDDAIKAYKTLALNKPAEREKFEQRIAELEELKKKQ